MSLNSAMVYRRTDRGLREVYEKSHQFTQSERLVLILLDGRLNVAGLRARLPSLDNERIEANDRQAGGGRPRRAGGVGRQPAVAESGRGGDAARARCGRGVPRTDSTWIPSPRSAGARDDVAAELVRASVDRAAAQLAREEEERGVPTPLGAPCGQGFRLRVAAHIMRRSALSIRRSPSGTLPKPPASQSRP